MGLSLQAQLCFVVFGIVLSSCIHLHEFVSDTFLQAWVRADTLMQLMDKIMYVVKLVIFRYNWYIFVVCDLQLIYFNTSRTILPLSSAECTHEATDIFIIFQNGRLHECLYGMLSMKEVLFSILVYQYIYTNKAEGISFFHSIILGIHVA